jgi:hypothetical protein
MLIYRVYERIGDVRSGRLSSYVIVERAPYLGESRARIGKATWKPLARACVEALVGEGVGGGYPGGGSHYGPNR